MFRRIAERHDAGRAQPGMQARIRVAFPHRLASGRNRRAPRSDPRPLAPPGTAASPETGSAARPGRASPVASRRRRRATGIPGEQSRRFAPPPARRLASRTRSAAATARRGHHGSHAGRQLENRPHGRALLGGRDRRTRGRRTVFVKAGTARQHYGIIKRASLRDEFPLSGDRVRTLEPQQYHSNTTALRRMVPPRRHGGGCRLHPPPSPPAWNPIPPPPPKVGAERIT